MNAMDQNIDDGNDLQIQQVPLFQSNKSLSQDSRVFSQKSKTNKPASTITTKCDEPILKEVVHIARNVLIKQEEKHSKMIIQSRPQYYYNGQMVLGQKCGFGKLTMRDGSYYEGQFLANKKHGVGTLINSDGSAFQGEFFGDDIIPQQGQHYDTRLSKIQKVQTLQAPTKLTFPNGAIYLGDVVNGLRHGQGKYTWADGTYYEGQFANDQINGFGEMIYQDGKRYRGFWLAGKMTKMGQFKWPDGRSYVGEYLNNKKHGFGIFKWNGGIRYVGFFKEGKMHGIGKLKQGNLKSIETVWECGKRLT